MKKILQFLAPVVLVWVAFAAYTQVAAHPICIDKPETRILMIGNSRIMGNNLQGKLARLLNDIDQSHCYEIELLAGPGRSLLDNVKAPEMKALYSQKWDYIFLQDAGFENTTIPNIKTYAIGAEAFASHAPAGSKVVLISGWPYRMSDPGFTPFLTEGPMGKLLLEQNKDLKNDNDRELAFVTGLYDQMLGTHLLLAQKKQLDVVNAGYPFVLSLDGQIHKTQDAKLNLYRDSTHPTDAGTYVFARTLAYYILGNHNRGGHDKEFNAEPTIVKMMDAMTAQGSCLKIEQGPPSNLTGICYRSH